jgi:two-component system, OmpR family, sensor histidine kinase TctE
MRSRSLRGELLAWLLIPLTAGVLFNVWTTYADALSTANIITDHTLLASARVIAEQVRDNDGVVQALIPPSALELFTSDAHDRVVYRVTTPDGELIASRLSPNAPRAMLSSSSPRHCEGATSLSPTSGSKLFGIRFFLLL